MNRLAALLVPLAMLVTSNLALGLTAEVCYSPAGDSAANEQTSFDCPDLGPVTMSEIATEGFKVVQLGLIADSSGGSSEIRTQLLIQKPDRFFRSGFER